MACKSQGNCTHAYRKGSADGIHCRIQTENGGKWDYCKYQYMCMSSHRYELSKHADTCNLPHNAAQPKDEKITAELDKPAEVSAVETPKKKDTKKPVKKTSAANVKEGEEE